MSARLKDSVVIVTGAAMGQGREHATRCAAEGARLVLGDVRTDELAGLADRLRATGAQVVAQRLDVGSADDWHSLVHAGVQEFGTVTGLVNNAGIMSPGSVLDESPQAWERTVAVNQTGMFLGMQAVAPVMQAARYGSIVNVASTLGRYASTVGFAYQATKGAVRMMSKSAALRLGPDGIRVNTVLPGLVDTPFLGDARHTGALDDSIRRTPLGRIGDPKEIASVVAFLLSDDASYVSGAELIVDGAMTAGSLGSLTNESLKEDA